MTGIVITGELRVISMFERVISAGYAINNAIGHETKFSIMRMLLRDCLHK